MGDITKPKMDQSSHERQHDHHRAYNLHQALKQSMGPTGRAEVEYSRPASAASSSSPSTDRSSPVSSENETDEKAKLNATTIDNDDDDKLKLINRGRINNSLAGSAEIASNAGSELDEDDDEDGDDKEEEDAHIIKDGVQHENHRDDLVVPSQNYSSESKSLGAAANEADDLLSSLEDEEEDEGEEEEEEEEDYCKGSGQPLDSIDQLGQNLSATTGNAEHRPHQHNNSSMSKSSSSSSSIGNSNVKQVELFGVKIVALTINSRDRLCLAQISNTLLKEFSYNEIHNRRVALGITCVQCTPIQLEMLRRAGAMPSSSRRCGMITMREAERLCRSFLVDEQPPELPDNFYFTVAHRINYGCRGRFVPARYISSRAKCIECFFCGDFFSPNKFIFHSHRQPHANECNPPDSPNINSWRKHIDLDWTQEHSQDIKYAWEDVKSLFNGGTRKRGLPFTLTAGSNHHHHHHHSSSSANDGGTAAKTGASIDCLSPASGQPGSNEPVVGGVKREHHRPRHHHPTGAAKSSIGSHANNNNNAKRIKRTSGAPIAPDLILNVDGIDEDGDDDGETFNHHDEFKGSLSALSHEISLENIISTTGSEPRAQVSSLKHPAPHKPPPMTSNQTHQVPLWRQQIINQKQHQINSINNNHQLANDQQSTHTKPIHHHQQQQQRSNLCGTPINWPSKGAKKKQQQHQQHNLTSSRRLNPTVSGHECGGAYLAPEVNNNDLCNANPQMQPMGHGGSVYHNHLNNLFSSPPPSAQPMMHRNVQQPTSNNNNNSLAPDQLILANCYSQQQQHQEISHGRLDINSSPQTTANYQKTPTMNTLNPMLSSDCATTIPSQLALRQQFWSSLFANLQQQQQQQNNNNLEMITSNLQTRQTTTRNPQKSTIDLLVQDQHDSGILSRAGRENDTIQQQQQQQQQQPSLFLQMNNPLMNHLLAAQLTAHHHHQLSLDSTYDSNNFQQQQQQQHQPTKQQPNMHLFNQGAHSVDFANELSSLDRLQSGSEVKSSSTSSLACGNNQFAANLAANLISSGVMPQQPHAMAPPPPLAQPPGGTTNNFRPLHPAHH